MPLVDVELAITRHSNAQLTAGLRVELPSHRQDLAEWVSLSLAPTDLLTCAHDLEGYGAALTTGVFPPVLREAWQRARGLADADGSPIRLRLALAGDDALHTLRWELLRDPLTGTPFVQSERVLLSRFLSVEALDPAGPSSPGTLRAVIAVASPATLPAFQLEPLDVPAHVAAPLAGLGPIAPTVLDDQDGRAAASLAMIAAALRDGADIFYLVCHGTLVDGQPYLWLEQPVGVPYRPVAGDDLAAALRQLPVRPSLVVLASCVSAGDADIVLGALGPQLIRAGVRAVIAMQGNVPAELPAALAPPLFAELRRDGSIDRALAAARAALPAHLPFWAPVLWLAARDGQLWPPADGPVAEVARPLPAAPQRSGSGPFVVGHALQPHESIFGRDALLRRCAEALRGGTSINLVGERAMGKTSVLNHLLASRGRLYEAPLLVARIDLRMAPTAADFYAVAVATLAASPTGQATPALRALALAARDPAQATPGLLERALAAVGKARPGVLPLLAIDDFEVLLRPEKAGYYRFPDFFDQLGALVDARQLALLVASDEPLARYCHDRPDQMTSSFYRSLVVERLEPLTPADAEALLLQEAGPLTLSNAEARAGARWAHGRPRLLQIAGAALAAARVEGHNLRWAERRFRSQAGLDSGGRGRGLLGRLFGGGRGH